MHKTTNKHGSLTWKIVNVKSLSSISSMSKMGKFKIFSKVVKSQIESASDKTGAAEDKINIKFRHHLFFFVKAKK